VVEERVELATTLALEPPWVEAVAVEVFAGAGFLLHQQ
jgi:hypothetical protein